jgi:hypothetical protein
MTEGANDLTPRAITKVLGEKVLLLYTHRERVLRSKLPLNTFIRYYAEAEDPSREEVKLLERLEELRREDPGRLVNLIEEAAALAAPKKEEEGEKKRYVLSQVLPGPVVVEAVGVPNSLGDHDPKLLVYGSNGFEISEFYKVGDSIIMPRSPRSYPYSPYVLNELDSVKNRLDLIAEVYREVTRYLDVAQVEAAIITGFVLLTYVQDLFSTVPYLHFVGDPESGKSHATLLLGSLMYRPLVGGCMTAADIFTYLGNEDVPLTLIEDEIQNTERDPEKVKILRMGYKRGFKIPRVVLFEGGRRIDYFSPFGVKVLAGERPINDRAVLQRCVLIEMMRGEPERDEFTEEDQLRLSPLRADLLKWRCAVIGGSEILNYARPQWLKSRPKEIFGPILTVLHGSSLYPLVEKFVLEQIERRRLSLQTSLESTVLSIVLELLENNQSHNSVEFGQVWEQLMRSLAGEPINYKGAVATSYAFVCDRFGKVTKKRISQILGVSLSMSKQPTVEDGRKLTYFIVKDRTKLEKACKKYALEVPAWLRTSDSSTQNSVYLVNLVNSISEESPLPERAENRRSDGLESQSGSDILSRNQVNQVNQVNRVTEKSDRHYDSVIYHAFLLPALSSRFSSNHHKQQTETSKPETADKSNKAEVIEETNEPKTEQARILNGLEEARRRLEEAVNQLEPEVKTFLDTYRVDDSGYSCIRCKCGSSFFSAEDFEAHIRFGSCKARRCSCGDSWLTLSELLEHVRKTNCSINPSPPPDPPEKGTKRRWRRLHGNGDLVLGGDE